MKNKLTSFFTMAVALTTAAQAQLTLNNFSNLVSSQTQFFGEWSDTGDPFAGSTVSSSLLSQDVSFYSINGATNADTSYFENSFASSLNLGGYSQLSLSLRLLGNNTADSLTVFLLDGAFRTASATFLTSSFNANSFSEVSLFFTADAGFDVTDVDGFRISGNDAFGSAVLGVQIDNLASAGLTTNAVPEPSTYGLIAAGVLLMAIGFRKKRLTAKS